MIPEVHNPLALLLLGFVPVIILVGRASMAGLGRWRAFVSTFLRCAILLAIVLALADLHIARTSDDLTVIFALDQSESVPASWRKREGIRAINNVVRAADLNDRLGLVLFGGDASIEKVPQPLHTRSVSDVLSPARLKWITSLSSTVSSDRSDIANAIRLATAAFPADSKKRLVLISDGNETSGIAIEEAERAKAEGVAIDVLPIAYQYDQEVLVEKVLVPARLKVGEPFILRAVVWASQDCVANITFTQDGALLGKPGDDRTETLRKGKNMISRKFKEGFPEGGTYTFEAVVQCDQDSIRDNNTGRGSTYVETGKPEVLIVEYEPEHARYLANALREDNMNVAVKDVGSMPADNKLAGYDTIVLSNVPAGDLTTRQMQTIASCVRDMGVGLVWIGGENSFGAGGWRNTAIEQVSPIDCDIKQRRVLPKGALVLVLDAAEVAGGNRWCVEMVAQAIKALSSRDEVGIMVNHNWFVPLGPVGNKGALLSKVQDMQVGDASDFNGMMETALKALTPSNASIKHVVMMSDAGPCPWTPSKLVIRQYRKRKVSLTNVVFEPHPGIAAQQARIMERLAVDCRGSFYWPKQPDELPQIFLKEASLVTRALIHEDPFEPKRSLSDYGPIVEGLSKFPSLHGYVIVTAKPDAEVPLIREFMDEKIQKGVQKDPILAHRNVGLGKTVAFMSDAKNRWGSEWLEWGGYNQFWSQTVRWSLRAAPKGSVHTPTTIEISNGKAHIVVEAMDEDGWPVTTLQLMANVVRPEMQEEADRIIPVRMMQTGVGRYEGWFDATATGSYFVQVHYEGTDNKGLPAVGNPVSVAEVPYSPEYREFEPNLSLLENIAMVTGGRVLDENDDIFDRADLPIPRTAMPVWNWLMIFAICAFPLDVFVRKVVIDRQQVAAAATAVATRLPFIGSRFEKHLPTVDPAIARLLARKREVRERIDQTDEEQSSAVAALMAARQQDVAHRQATEMADEEIDKGMATLEHKDPKRQPTRAETAGRKADDEATPYTQRLLQAKKRARRGKKEE